MPCIRIPNGDLPDGFVCYSPVYEFDGYLFEVHSYHGPWPLRRKDFEPWERMPTAGFWEMWDKFSQFSGGAKRACLYKEA